jgi:hypothetical protein
MAVVLYHPTFGVLLDAQPHGEDVYRYVFSHVHPETCIAAPVFANAPDAWALTKPVTNAGPLKFVAWQVTPDGKDRKTGHPYASIDACMAAGLPAWLPDYDGPPMKLLSWYETPDDLWPYAAVCDRQPVHYMFQLATDGHAQSIVLDTVQEAMALADRDLRLAGPFLLPGYRSESKKKAMLGCMYGGNAGMGVGDDGYPLSDTSMKVRIPLGIFVGSRAVWAQYSPRCPREWHTARFSALVSLLHRFGLGKVA